MDINFGIFHYILFAIIFFLLLIIFATRWRGKIKGTLFFFKNSVAISRVIFFYSSIIVLTVCYLLIMFVGSRYLVKLSDEWGVLLSIIFVSFSSLIFLFFTFSNHARARINVFIDKHFLEYKYDYREQWLGLIRALSSADNQTKLEFRALRAMTDIMHSPGGSLWVRKNQQQYAPVVEIEMPEIEGETRWIAGKLFRKLAMGCQFKRVSNRTRII